MLVTEGKKKGGEGRGDKEKKKRCAVPWRRNFVAWAIVDRPGAGTSRLT